LHCNPAIYFLINYSWKNYMEIVIYISQWNATLLSPWTKPSVKQHRNMKA